EHVEEAVRLVAATNGTTPPYPRLAAALLAEAQPPADLGAVFAGGARAHAPEELRACLVHELVLRGT
ncbi:hypothetical protein G3I76_08240, partial [Streptomyces sp. SID11233]|nr:hypothetical protein [Streptomyces sp. SID11233]